MYKPLNKNLLILFCWLLMSVGLQAQAFKAEIDRFKQEDLITPKPPGQIVFVGSSSFRMWHDLQQDFPEYPIINRGFGGSTLLDVIRYADDIIIPYRPKQVVIYCGENDLAVDSTLTGKDVFNRFKQLVKLIRQDDKKRAILFVSLKPSPSRAKLFDKMINTNARIQKYCSAKTNMAFANVFDPMLDQDQKPKRNLFISDQLHMTRAGYEIWKEVIRPYLLK